MKNSVIRRHAVAFTMVELLVVIAIMSLLAAILLPAIHKVMYVAKRAQAQEDIHQLSIAWQTYLGDHREFPTDENGDIVAINEMDTNAVGILLGHRYTEFTNRLYMEFRTNHAIYGFLDPWGDRKLVNGDPSWGNHRYQILLDNGEGPFDTRAYDGEIRPPQFAQPVRLDVFVWSRGQDGINATKDDVVGK